MVMESKMEETPRYTRVAKWLSWMFHPFVIIIPTMIISMYATTNDWLTALGWTAVCVGFVVVPASLYIRRKVKRNEYTDADVSVREHRSSIYLFMGIAELLCFITLVVFGAPKILIACFIAAILTLAMGALINTRTKVSAHMAGMGGCTAVLFYLSPLLGLFMLIASLATGWARIYLKQHTLMQVLIGWGMAVVSVVIVFIIGAQILRQ